MDVTRLPEERQPLEGQAGQTLFPSLGVNFEVIGPSTEDFNCIAYTLGNMLQWINPETGPAEEPFALMDQKYQAHQYSRRASADFTLEPRQSKVAVYARRNPDGSIQQITHAALQEVGGRWVSKLGQGPLIRHPTLEALNGPLFGEPVAVYVRPISENPP